jgi:hypothetical protein
MLTKFTFIFFVFFYFKAKCIWLYNILSLSSPRLYTLTLWKTTLSFALRGAMLYLARSFPIKFYSIFLYFKIKS